MSPKYRAYSQISEISDMRDLIVVMTNENPPYWQALGEFIEVFARTELALFFLLGRFADVTLPVANAIFSGDRVDTLSSKIRRIWAVNPPADAIFSEFDDVLTQFKAIATMRNTILHYAAEIVAPGERVSTNEPRAHTQDAIKTFRVSEPIIRTMIDDLFKIANHIYSFLHEPGVPLAERMNKYPNVRESWQYKSQSNQQNQKQKKGST